MGIGQLSLVEHSLCPLDARTSVTENLVHGPSYLYSDACGKRRKAKVRVYCPLGLSPRDELYLWGLLALTLAQPDDLSELQATPHWCLRKMGLIGDSARPRRGGTQYRTFYNALRRLSAVSYLNDAFYDPGRQEHRRVSFRFFSYSLPEDLASRRTWRIAWDPIFFEMASSTSGQFRFDMALYRQLDPAARRLFLFLSKVFPRRDIHSLDPVDLGIHLLGFSDDLAPRTIRAKVRRCVEKLRDLNVIGSSEEFATPNGYPRLRLTCGKYFSRPDRAVHVPTVDDNPLYDALLSIGFESGAARSLTRTYSPRLLGEWIDITQAAIEFRGPDFFKRSPMAFLVDSISKAARGERTPPDWWRDVQKRELTKQETSADSQSMLARLSSEVFGDELNVVDDGDPVAQSGLQSIGDVLRKT